MTSNRGEKSAFQKFIEANQALLKCYNTIDMDALISSNNFDTPAKCTAERDRVKELLQNNDLSMSNLVRERIAIVKVLEDQAAKRPKPEEPFYQR